MDVLRLLLVTLVLLLPDAARATVYNNRVCVDVDIRFADDAFGTRWTDDSDDKPGRGFWVEVTHGSAPVVQDWPPVSADHYVATSGTFAGCTDDIAFDTSLAPYTIRVRSEALVDNVTLVALDDSSPAVKAESVVNYTPTADQDVSVVVSGSDARWNLLALDAFALTLHNPTTGSSGFGRVRAAAETARPR